MSMYRCGPAAIRAVRDGEVQRPYDVAYVYAGINSDKVVWQYFGKIQPLKLLSYDTDSIGRNISTKAIGKMTREDLTNTYKYPEGTRKERKTLENALRKSKSIFARYYLNEVFNEVTFDFELLDDIKIGQNFNVVTGFVSVNTVTFTGARGGVVKKTKFKLNLAPKGKELVKMLVTFDDYYKKLVDQASFIIGCLGRIVDANFDFFAQDNFRVRNPDIKISIDNKPVSHQEFTVSVKVENPLPIPLTNCKFYIQGLGLDKQLKIQLKKNVAPGEFVAAKYKFTPPWAGRHQISAKSTSKELRDVDGFLSIMVVPPI